MLLNSSLTGRFDKNPQHSNNTQQYSSYMLELLRYTR
jgi:hypothetical protein